MNLTIKFFQNILLKTKEVLKSAEGSLYLLAIVLSTLPLGNIYVSIATILFLVITFFSVKKSLFKIQKDFYFPIVFFLVMIMSLIWSVNIQSSLSGLQKSLSFIVFPFAFFALPNFNKDLLNKIFKIFSFSMSFYALFYLLNALVGFVDTHDFSLFFYNSLVPIDPGAVYMSVFASFALFYFIQLSHKSVFEIIALSILTIFLFLLSSKSIITVDFIIIICYYAFFAEIPSSTKTLTIFMVSVFLFFSIFFVKEVKERFMIEYETAFVDNTLENSLEKANVKIHNVSIEEAWNDTKFNKTDFFPGTALRIYQIRIFKEIMLENNKFLTGFGLEASQEQIRLKASENNLHQDYGEYNFHNQYLQTFAELGILGLIVLVWMLFVNIINALRNKDFLHIAFAITMIMLFLSESFFCRQRGIVFFIVLYCLFNVTTTKQINKNPLIP